ncbi:MAG TPA: AraC family transcriptional regulator [Candidatus Acidoferrum sp.]
MKSASKDISSTSSRASELRAELARKIASFMGSEENRATDISGLTLHQRIAPTAPCSATYEPGVTVMAQGRKRVDLGRTTFIYGESRYLLTSLDLPIVSQIIEASADVPCLAMSLKLEMPVIRELLSREEIHVAEPPADSPAMATGEATVEFLDACCRLMDLLDTPQDVPFLSGLIQRAIIYRILRGPEGHAFERLQHWEIRATGPQKQLPGSRQTTRSRYGSKNWHKLLVWACPRCTIISER